MARPKGIWTPDVVRRRIQTTKLAQRLQDHALGLVDMSPTQVTAAKILLGKVVADQKAVEHSGNIGRRRAPEMTEAELERIASRGRDGASETTQGTTEPAAVH